MKYLCIIKRLVIIFFSEAILRLAQDIKWLDPPKGKAENGIKYVGRYSFRVAISNNRIKNIKINNVTFCFLIDFQKFTILSWIKGKFIQN